MCFAGARATSRCERGDWRRISSATCPRSGREGAAHQLLQNLFGNGLKFHARHRPGVGFTRGGDDEYWEIRVLDNGIGIEPEYAEGSS